MSVVSFEEAKKTTRKKRGEKGGGGGPGGGAGDDSGRAPKGPVYTEDRLALEMAARHGDRLRYDHSAEQWLIWNGQLWRPDKTNQVTAMARELARELAGDLSASDRKTLGRRATAVAVVGLLATDRKIALTTDDLDRDPLLLGTPDGTVDLRDGKLRRGRPDELITMSTAASPAPPGTPAPLFDALLDFMTGNDAAEPGWDRYRRYVLSVLGLCLTGLSTEHLVFFFYGPGGNGKGTLLDTFQALMGDYAVAAPMEMFVETHSDRHPAELMLLKRRRLVRASEVNEGSNWNQQRLKVLSGGDPIAARGMGADWEIFQPTHHLVLMADTRPMLRSVDDGIRRRFRLMPFLRKPEKIDKDLRDKLKAEWPAILRLCIDAWLDVQAAGGLPACDEVEAETEAYLEQQDTLQQWIADVAAEDQRPLGSREMAHRLWRTGDLKAELIGNVYKAWVNDCEAAGEKPGTMKSFRQRLNKAGFYEGRTKVARWVLGLKLRQPGESRRDELELGG